MFSETSDVTQLLFQGLAGLLLLAGTTVDLCLAGLAQTRRLTPSLRARTALSQSPFAAFQTALVLSTALLFALAALFQSPAAEPPKESALFMGPLFYAFTGLLTVMLCLTYSRIPAKRAFFVPGCTAGQALRKGLLYGLAVLPPVTLLSLLTTTLTEKLGYEPQLQDIFDWLSNDAYAAGTRAFMMVAAVVIAPVVEELLFRGILFPAVLKGRSFLFAALVSGTFFALVHLHAPSFLPLLVLGIAFSAGYAATGSILTPIIMHALFNLTSVVFFLAD